MNERRLLCSTGIIPSALSEWAKWTVCKDNNLIHAARINLKYCFTHAWHCNSEYWAGVPATNTEVNTEWNDSMAKQVHLYHRIYIQYLYILDLATQMYLWECCARFLPKRTDWMPTSAITLTSEWLLFFYTNFRRLNERWAEACFKLLCGASLQYHSSVIHTHT